MNPSNYKTQAQKAVNKGFIIESYLFLGSGSGIGGGSGGTSSYLYQKETTTYKSGGGSGGVSGGGGAGGSSSNYNMAYGESTTADYDMATPANYTSNTLSSSMGSGLGGGGGGTLGGSNTMSNTMSKSGYNTMSSYSYQVRNRCPLFSVISWFVCFCYCGVFFVFVIHLLISKHG